VSADPEDAAEETVERGSARVKTTVETKRGGERDEVTLACRVEGDPDASDGFVWCEASDDESGVEGFEWCEPAVGPESDAVADGVEAGTEPEDHDVGSPSTSAGSAEDLVLPRDLVTTTRSAALDEDAVALLATLRRNPEEGRWRRVAIELGEDE
jgi:hypothetical protein